ncbi:NF-X1-type zinc finger protein NFXL2 [Ananas comosus]|uniref:NF-X1-type zinc finger protein NFXL2 n=1 Tax=Ananas comosus TaxID=4615 RepID=A0A199V0D3_ANACO|nr:NF-X1-type zinc finger protein NFXL2 [Ananas comosus]
MATTTTITPLPPRNPNPNPNSPAPSDHPLLSSSSASDDDDDASDDVSNGDADPSSAALERSIFASYLRTSPDDDDAIDDDLSKLRSFLSSSSLLRRRLPSCLICLDPLRPSHPVWSCSASCHALFHLPCIQSWARQSLHLRSPDWPCPKCRSPYPKTLIPKSYFCFCGKVQDPPLDPWILPHSCGEICGRPLAGECGHTCLLLCHPGPCPPCPVLASSQCFCGRRADVRRCARRRFSCGEPCNKPLPCGSHRCPTTCHDGPCLPCRVRGTYKCACGAEEQERICAEREFRCDRPCGGTLACGRHECGRGCHAGACGACPLQGRRTCPCGKKEHLGLSCDAQVPTCGSTCGKMLGCGMHRCPERCHRGACVENCRIVVLKSCRCGSMKKEVPCYQDLTCERKCQRVRDCGRHACRRRCCGGDCPPCPEICDRKLRCNNHKCPSPCHRGACSPCPLMVSISCYCGETRFEVPCGTEKNQKPPKCSKRCFISRLCRHKSECRPHKCHYGACPPCRMTCGEELPCSHKCRERCHGPIPPPNPEFTLKPKKKRIGRSIECTPGSPCPPCREIVLVSCFGQHIGEERPLVCSTKKPFPCQNLCGNLLPCGNHYCTKSCHVLKSQLFVLDHNEKHENSHQQESIILPFNAQSPLAEPCEECYLPCQKDREPSCSHPCPLRCHSDNCPPCKVLVKRACHCGAMVHVFECLYYNSMSDEEQQRVRTCSGPCHRKLPNCPHLCSEICHPGQCPSSDRCLKKVNVRCACNTVKREWLCQDVVKAYRNAGRDPKDVSKTQFGVGLLPCGVDCKRKVKVVDSELHLRKANEIKSPVVEAADVPKRRKRRERVQETKQISKFQEIKKTIWRCLLVMLLFIVVVLIAYFGYKGIFCSLIG